MSEELPSLSPKFEGERFKNHSIPVELLADLAAYRDLVRDVAKVLYKKAHPEKKRVPRAFEAAFKLSLRDVAEGSAVAELVNDVTDAEPAEIIQFSDYFRDGKELVDDAIRSVQADSDKPNADFPLPAAFPMELLPEFGKIGRHLKPGERIDFGFGEKKPAIYSDSVRSTLVLWASEEIEQDIDEVGHVQGVYSTPDDDKFDIKLKDGAIVSAPRPVAQQADIVDAYLNRKTHALRVKGTGVFNRQKRMLKISEVKDAEVLDEEDQRVVTALDRIAQMASLPSGWCGPESVPPSAGTTTWATFVLKILVEAHRVRAPFVFPTPSGGVQFEWKIPDGAIDLRLSIEKKTGELTAYGEGDMDVDVVLSLDSAADLAAAATTLNDLNPPTKAP